MASLTEKQLKALSDVKSGQPIAMVHAGKLRDMGLVTTTGRASPGYISCSMTPSGEAALA